MVEVGITGPHDILSAQQGLGRGPVSRSAGRGKVDRGQRGREGDGRCGHHAQVVAMTHGHVIAPRTCLLYTSDAADERSSVDLGGRRIIKKKKRCGVYNGAKMKKYTDKDECTEECR